MDEQAYIQGSRAAWTAMLQRCLIELGIDDPLAGNVRWVMEREQTIAALRDVCERHGDNDWDEHLHLADIIEKHLARHIDA